MEEIDYGFLKKYGEYIALYKEHRLPVMLCDNELNVGMANLAMKTLYQHLTGKHGFDRLLGEFDKPGLLRQLSSGEAVWLGNLIGLSDIQLGLTPIMKKNKLYGVVVELVGESSVILPPKAMLSSQTPLHIESSIRKSVAGMFSAMDAASHMEDLLLEKADLKGLGLETGFISESYDNISKHCYYLLRMAKNLSAYAELNANPPTPVLASVDIFGLISKNHNAIKLLAAEMGIPVDFSFSGDGLAGLDVDKFELAFFNILNNAFYFTRDENTITITGKSNKDTVSVTVSDCGIGIPKDVLPHVFDSYFAFGHGSKPAGIGLGLTLAKSMIEAHGGKISIKSTKGEGTKATITIPRGISARRQTELCGEDKSLATDRFSYLYVGLADAAASPYNTRNQKS